MGFLDKVQKTIDKGQDKLGDLQSKRKADQLLRDLGAWHYASLTGRDGGEAAGHIARLIAELQAHEAEHGQLGAADADDDDATAPGPAAAAPPPPAAPADPAAPAAPAAPAPPPPPAAPVTSGPPPPPPG